MTIYYTDGIYSDFVKVEDYLKSGEHRYPVHNIFYLDGKEVHPAECWISYGMLQTRLDDKTIRLKHISCDKDYRDHIDIPIRKFWFESLIPEEEEAE